MSSVFGRMSWLRAFYFAVSAMSFALAIRPSDYPLAAAISLIYGGASLFMALSPMTRTEAERRAETQKAGAGCPEPAE